MIRPIIENNNEQGRPAKKSKADQTAMMMTKRTFQCDFPVDPNIQEPITIVTITKDHATTADICMAIQKEKGYDLNQLTLFATNATDKGPLRLHEEVAVDVLDIIVLVSSSQRNAHFHIAIDADVTPAGGDMDILDIDLQLYVKMHTADGGHASISWVLTDMEVGEDRCVADAVVFQSHDSIDAFTKQRIAVHYQEDDTPFYFMECDIFIDTDSDCASGSFNVSLIYLPMTTEWRVIDLRYESQNGSSIEMNIHDCTIEEEDSKDIPNSIKQIAGLLKIY
jgi:hypothetical protein